MPSARARPSGPSASSTPPSCRRWRSIRPARSPSSTPEPGAGWTSTWTPGPIGSPRRPRGTASPERSSSWGPFPGPVGTTVEVRLPVDAGILEIRHRGEVVVTHSLAPPGSPLVWDPAHRAAAEAIALAPHRRHQAPLPTGQDINAVVRLDLGPGDYDVDEVDLSRYDAGCGCTGRGR